MERQSNLEFYIICLRYELQRDGLAKLILQEPISEILKNNVSSFKHLYLCIRTLMRILLNGASVQLGILYNLFTVLAPTWWLGKTHSSRADFRNIKKQCVKFQKSVSLYFDFNGNIPKYNLEFYIIFLRYELQP